MFTYLLIIWGIDHLMQWLFITINQCVKLQTMKEYCCLSASQVGIVLALLRRREELPLFCKVAYQLECNHPYRLIHCSFHFYCHLSIWLQGFFYSQIVAVNYNIEPNLAQQLQIVEVNMLFTLVCWLTPSAADGLLYK